ncbi:MAG TPA: ATP12 family protein [Methylocella sp.]|nr:ATP12 family protein [Methylocella sp.]
MRGGPRESVTLPERPPPYSPNSSSPEGADPIALARRGLKKAHPKRFYQTASAEPRGGAYALLLDGRPARTPRGNLLALPTQAAGRLLAEEWLAQEAWIDPLAMPLTRIVNTAIDGVARKLDATAEDIAKYAGADLVCYRAEGPRALAEAQAAAWDRVLSFAREKLGARFVCSAGVSYVEQPDSARKAVRDVLNRIAGCGAAAPFAIAALHVMTTLTGSVLIALGAAEGEWSLAEAWAAAHVDEDFQIQAWGEDAEAMERRARQWREFEAAGRLLQSLKI